MLLGYSCMPDRCSGMQDLFRYSAVLARSPESSDAELFRREDAFRCIVRERRRLAVLRDEARHARSLEISKFRGAVQRAQGKRFIPETHHVYQQFRTSYERACHDVVGPEQGLAYPASPAQRHRRGRDGTRAEAFVQAAHR
jgi:hypothetical protein